MWKVLKPAFDFFSNLSFFKFFSEYPAEAAMTIAVSFLIAFLVTQIIDKKVPAEWRVWIASLVGVAVVIITLAFCLYFGPRQDEIEFVFEPSNSVYVQDPAFRKKEFNLDDGWWRYSIGVKALHRIDNVTATIVNIEHYDDSGHWSHADMPSAPCQVGWNGIKNQFDPITIREESPGILIFAGYSADTTVKDHGFNLGCEKGNPEIRKTYNMQFGEYRMVLYIYFDGAKKDYKEQIRLGWYGEPSRPFIGDYLVDKRCTIGGI